MSTTPPGWYDDGHGALRWWDGTQWTEHVQTPDPLPAAPAGPLAETAPAIPPAPTLESARADAGPAAPAQTPAYTAPDTGFTAPEHAAPHPAAGAVPAVPSAPPGYPGGFPGGPSPAGGFIAATEPKKSKLWILWVVLGVVLLGIVILAAVLIPILIGVFGTVANSGSSGSASDADEASAVAAVELYDEAWRTEDCDMFIESTTEDFREEIGHTDCASFEDAAQGFNESVDGYEIAVQSVETGDEAITVETVESFTTMFDEDDNPSDVPVPYEEFWTYTVVPSDGGWAIDDAY